MKMIRSIDFSKMKFTSQCGNILVPLLFQVGVKLKRRTLVVSLLIERPETLPFPILDAHGCTISRQNLTVRDQKDFPVASFHTHLFPGARKDLSKKRDLDRNNLLKIAPDQAQEIANGPHLDVYQVPGHRT